MSLTMTYAEHNVHSFDKKKEIFQNVKVNCTNELNFLIEVVLLGLLGLILTAFFKEKYIKKYTLLSKSFSR